MTSDGFTNEPVGDEHYIGCLLRGKFLKARYKEHVIDSGREREPNAVETSFLQELQADPVRFFAESSKDMGRCCYCNLPLEDPRSKEVGYGSTCAEKWGLPWGTKGRSEGSKTFAEAWMSSTGSERKTIRDICTAVKLTPLDSLSWMALNDALADAGHVRVKPLTAPARAVVMPRD